MQLLLLSNSTLKGQSYLGWPQKHLSTFLQGVKNILFIPYAGVTINYDEYTESVKNALSDFNLDITGIHTVYDKIEQIKAADCIMIGGGNTFSLLSSLQNEGLIKPIKQSIKKGAKFVGWSAGSNMACPTIKTTNDMPIEQPLSFDALGLIGFQINPHFTNEVIPNHGGESRALRLKEYLIMNPKSTVVGLPEGMLLEVDGDNLFLKGEGEAFLFKKGVEAQVLNPGKLEISF